MANLKHLKKRIDSVKSSKKITSAMKMVASANVRKFQKHLSFATTYLESAHHTFHRCLKGLPLDAAPPPIVTGRKNIKSPLLVVFSGNKGLCGPFNSNLAAQTIQTIKKYQAQNHSPQILLLGSKILGSIEKDYKHLIIESYEDINNHPYSFFEQIAHKISQGFYHKKFDQCSILCTRFHSIMKYNVEEHVLIPFSSNTMKLSTPSLEKVYYGIEPAPEEMLEILAGEYVAAQLYFSFVHNTMSEAASRMIAMDNATRNAEKMIGDLQVVYNRSRQSSITKELIEIIAGAESI